MNAVIIPAARPRAASGSLRISAAFLLLAGLAAIVPWVPHLDRIVLAVTMAGALVVFVGFRSSGAGFDWFEVGIVYGLFFFVSYGLGALWFSFMPGEMFRRTQLENLTPALAVSLAGFLSFLAGYTFLVRRARPAALVHLVPRGMITILAIAGLGFAGHVAGALAASGRDAGLSGLMSGLHQLSPFLVVGWFMAWHAFFRAPRTTGRIVATLVLLAGMAATVAWLNLGSKEITLRFFAVPALAFWYAKKRLPVRFLAALVLLAVFVVFPLYNTFRYTARTLDTGTRVERTIDLASDWDGGTYYARTVEAFASRLSYISSTAAVVRDVGRWVDYRRGETLFLAPISLFIPRFMWPDKPSIVIGREFAHTFRLVHWSDDETQVAASSIGDLYWNFDVPGVVLGMFLIGAFFRWIYRKYGEEAGFDDPYRRGLYVAILAVCWGIEGGIAAGIAGLARLVVVATLVAFALERIGLLVRVSPPAAESVS